MSTQSLPLPELQDEMRVIFKAAEQHPKNYYAWTYARFIWLKIYSPKQSIPKLTEQLRTWCTSNVGDHSGWMFYLWYWGAERPWKERLIEITKPSEVTNYVLDMATNVVPGHEVLWAFLRAAAVGMEKVLSPEEREIFIGTLRQYLKRLEECEGDDICKDSNLIFVQRAIRFLDKVRN
jgi:hypothetical protein